MVHVKINQSEDISLGFLRGGLQEINFYVPATLLEVWAAMEEGGLVQA